MSTLDEKLKEIESSPRFVEWNVMKCLADDFNFLLTTVRRLQKQLGIAKDGLETIAIEKMHPFLGKHTGDYSAYNKKYAMMAEAKWTLEQIKKLESE